MRSASNSPPVSFRLAIHRHREKDVGCYDVDGFKCLHAVLAMRPGGLPNPAVILKELCRLLISQRVELPGKVCQRREHAFNFPGTYGVRQGALSRRFEPGKDAIADLE